jgi:hypothetical protein
MNQNILSYFLLAQALTHRLYGILARTNQRLYRYMLVFRQWRILALSVLVC